MQTPSAGGAYQLIFTQRRAKLIIHDVMIGEVWLCSGQSNMAMPTAGFSNQPIRNAAEILADAEDANVRLFKVQNARSDSPLTEVGGKWALSDV